MKTQEFLQILESNTNTSLLFEYTSGQLVGANYHITEVKHVSVDSVDCGEYMTSHKALEILNTVGKIKTYDLNSEVKIEYSNSLFHTAQLFVSDFELSNGKLLFKLDIEKTDCKAKEICGVNEPVELASEGSSCAPGSGCC